MWPACLLMSVMPATPEPMPYVTVYLRSASAPASFASLKKSFFAFMSYSSDSFALLPPMSRSESHTALTLSKPGVEMRSFEKSVPETPA